jgi:hypothetical protein
LQYFVFSCIISYIVSPENLTCYYIQNYWISEQLTSTTTRNTTFLKWILRLNQQRCRRRRRRSGLLVRLRRREHHPSLPSILLANVQSLDNKVNKIRAKVAFQRDIRDCNILYFMKSWLSRDMLSESVQPPGFFVSLADRSKHLSGKKGGVVCFMINDPWCNCNNIKEFKSFCSPDLEFVIIKCRPYYLPREFSLVIVTAVYIHLKPIQRQPSRNFIGLYGNWKPCIPKAAFIVAGYCNKANLRTRLPILYQYIDYSTRAGKTLDHC